MIGEIIGFISIKIRYCRNKITPVRILLKTLIKELIIIFLLTIKKYYKSPWDTLRKLLNKKYFLFLNNNF